CAPPISIQLGDRELCFLVWKVNVGRVSLYLLDTNVETNTPEDRTLSARLYTAQPEERLRQLIVLGMGGVRALRTLEINPAVWHANEDHTALMMLERVQEELRSGLSLDDAIEKICASTVFTTHTPIAAGHNIIPIQIMDRYAGNFWQALRIDKEAFLEMGRHPGLEPGKFSLAALALRLSGQANAVSRLHGQVARKMWHVLWPDGPEDKVPITHVTNGVHLPTWQAPEIQQLCQKYTGVEFVEGQDNTDFWKAVLDVPDAEFWEVHQLLKTRLIRLIQERAQRRWGEGTCSPQQLVEMGSLLDPYALTIAFSRRFTEYKRPLLILSDIERLKKLVNDPLRPLQIIFAGKSHPADFASKNLLNQVCLLTKDRTFQGRISFVEDYDMSLARDLVRGVDVWLNNPRRLQEACGTSGMKASMNGVINLSVRDGWWDEGYNATNGWAIGGIQRDLLHDEDKADAAALYDLLEKEVIPLYYDRDRLGVPHRWVQVSKEAVRSVSPVFNASRMVKDYTERMYLTAGRMVPPGQEGKRPAGRVRPASRDRSKGSGGGYE
ncbi:MAG: alpha-glucan family phosphorylase, partial [Chloroflexi bacterium]|nr:alpha-glucan family phosphorylase [Chloroflexota bacterium]